MLKKETFEERYNKYLEYYPESAEWMKERMKTMSKEELAFLLATHDKFLRISCAEYDDDNEYGDKVDPLGRKVNPWGGLVAEVVRQIIQDEQDKKGSR